MPKKSTIKSMAKFVHGHRQGQGHRRTGKGTQTNRERDTNEQGKGHRRTGTVTQMDRDSDTGGQRQEQRRKGQ